MIPPGPLHVPEPAPAKPPQQVSQAQEFEAQDRFVDFLLNNELDETVELSRDKEENHGQAELTERAPPEGQVLKDSVMEIPVVEEAVAQDNGRDIAMEVNEPVANVEQGANDNAVKIKWTTTNSQYLCTYIMNIYMLLLYTYNFLFVYVNTVSLKIKSLFFQIPRKDD